jgi:predicted CoA-substrate-specific enzyme activase
MAEYFAGVDIGSTMTKVVIMNEAVIASVIGATGPEHRKLANKVMEEALARAGLGFDEISYVVATGYGRINVPFADRQITEISCHARGVSSQLPTARTVIDIGGQDCKGIKLKNGRVVDFVMNDKCAAGTGRFLEVMAEGLGIRLEEMGELSLVAKNEVSISSTCTVFAEQEVVAKLAQGMPVADLVAGVHKSVATRVYRLVSRLKIEPDVAVTGGGARNIGLVRALEARLGYPTIIPPEPLLTGAIGAALLGKDTVRNAAENSLPLVRSRHPLQEASFFTSN